MVSSSIVPVVSNEVVFARLEMRALFEREGSIKDMIPKTSFGGISCFGMGEISGEAILGALCKEEDWVSSGSGREANDAEGEDG